MRLITKTTLLYLILIFAVFSIGGLLTYRMVQDMVKQETDWALRSDTRIVLDGIGEGKPIYALENAKVSIEEISNDIEEDPRGFFVDTLMMHRNLERIEEFRKLTSTHRVNDKLYRIIIADVFIESEDMQEGVTSTMTRLFLGLSLILLVFSFLFSKLLLKPFEQTLKSINQFTLTDNQALNLPKTNTSEFKELNHFVRAMTDKARNDYSALKEFSENASHEMQTPIAIIKGKLELLQESPNLKEDELKLISAGQNSLTKLSKLGQSLSLITKIENREYTTSERLNFSEIVRSAFENFNEFAAFKKLQFKEQIKNDVYIRIDSSLADILISNLIKNAVQHNIEDGWVEVVLGDSALIVKNSGLDPGVSPETLFGRFRKSKQSSSSLGLGLAIVKKICLVNHFPIRYSYENGVHEIHVSFQSEFPK